MFLEPKWQFSMMKEDLNGQNGGQIEQKYIFQNFHEIVLVIDHKYNFYMQNYQNTMGGLGEIGQNEKKMGQNGQSLPKKGRKIFFPKLSLNNYSNIP